jgi:8-oxo-dGTP diphosphatase
MARSASGEREWLAAYDPRAFPPFAVTVDMVLLTVTDAHFSVLLVERDTHPFRGFIALPGGFVQPDEDLDDAAVRRLEQETGVRRSAAYVEQLGAFGKKVDRSRLAFDHARVLAAGVERARAKLEYTPLAAAFCDEELTVADLRHVYEAVWGVALDPRNFHRKVTGTPGFLEPVGRPAPVGPEGGRPAALYRRGPATSLHPAMLRPSR